jgi:hypothetical protein
VFGIFEKLDQKIQSLPGDLHGNTDTRHPQHYSDLFSFSERTNPCGDRTRGVFNWV